MQRETILSIVAADKPGLVDVVSTAIAEHGGNWLASSMARLEGQFAGIVQVAIPADNWQAFETAMKGLAAHGIEVSLRAGAQGAADPARRMAELKLTGTDHPGIVRDISHALAQRGVSIEQFHTQLFKGSMSGGEMFAAEADLALPEGLDPDTLREALEEIAGDLLVEITGAS